MEKQTKSSVSAGKKVALLVLPINGSYVFKSVALANLYAAQLKKIDKAISSLHEDLQFEYYRILEVLK